MKENTRREFKERVWNFYKENKRDFPWRNTHDPYRVFISEICLQQTQTSRVIQKYKEILRTFPSIYDLSNARFSDILKTWVGLGYNRRAKYLHESAKLIVEKYNGVFPKDPLMLDELPGVGYNTAAAICVYSYNIPLIFIETNIRRIFIHHFFEDKLKVRDTEIMPLIEKTLDKKNPREWYWALMDYGSYLPKVTRNPNQRSAHYTKQSPFIGSSRQVRASILKLLISGPQTRNFLQAQIEGDVSHFDTAIAQLLKEGLVLQKEGSFSLQ